MRFHSIAEMIAFARDSMRHRSSSITTDTWQSLSTNDKPDMRMWELTNVQIQAPMPLTVDEVTTQCDPNIPWVVDHFSERVSGHPLNPPPSWTKWPYAHSASKFTDKDRFNHTYPERFWPRAAGLTDGGDLSHTSFEFMSSNQGHRGIYHRYGDFSDVINLLLRDPLTRQAYLPIFFPEDTGAHHRGRVPCTLGYHFMRRNDKLSIYYPIRSCDIVRHFQDDIYLAVRLAHHVITLLKCMDINKWSMVVPGDITMWIGSLHCFVNDIASLK